MKTNAGVTSPENNPIKKAMAFHFDPQSQQTIPEVEPPKERLGMFSIAIVAAFVLLCLTWLAWRPISNATRAALARNNADEARVAIGNQDWSRAYQALILARNRAPSDVEVIEAWVEFLKTTGHDPAGLAQQLRVLEQQRPLTADEDLLLGRSLIATGKTDEAREVYEELPPDRSTHGAGLELLSGILKSEGHDKEAAEIARRATAEEPESPEARLKLAAEDQRSSFVEVRNQARKKLWQLAELNTGEGLQAIARLAADPSLTLIEANRLMEVVGRHPLAELPSRLGVVSALMRLQPDQRATLASREVLRFQDRKEGRLEELAYWLMIEKQNTLVVKIIPQDLAMKSRELYPILMQTLAQEQRWEDLKTLLNVPNPPVARSLVNLAMARLQSHLEPDMKETRRLLTGTIESATLEGNIAILQAVASVAEEVNLADIAARAYQAAGIKAAASGASETALQSLQKSAELALLTRDTSMLLDVSRRLHELSPSSLAFADRLNYLRLILGEEMETVDLTALKPSNEGRDTRPVSLDRIPPPLLEALRDYRMGELTAIPDLLKTLPDTSHLSPGQRAVVAGLLSLAGKPDRAFQIAEKVPASLLLQEELAFLNRAR